MESQIRRGENRDYVRKLLKQKQPEFAAILERVVRELSIARTQFTGRTDYIADIKVPSSRDVILGPAEQAGRLGAPEVE